MIYRVALLCSALFILTALVRAVETPDVWLLGESTFVPAQLIAEKLGATYSFEKQTVTLAKDQASLTAPVNTDNITIMANGTTAIRYAPCFLLHGVPYLPLRVVAEVFSAALGYHPKDKTVRVTLHGGQPFTLTAAPFPRPACVKDDTLAGLTPGDHLAVALTRKNFTLDDEPSDLPGHVRYSAQVGTPRMLLFVYLDVKDEMIDRITVAMGRYTEYDQLPPQEDIGTASGIQLWSKLPPADLRRAVTLTRNPQDKSVILGISRGRLQVAVYRTNALTSHPITGAIVLAPRTAPKAWFQAHLVEGE